MKPDIVTMGKSITGGFYPQSFIMGMDTVMASVGPYEMTSTYGFSPLAIAAADATMDVIDGENLVERAVHLGSLWRETVESWHHPLVDHVAQIGADSNLILRGVKPSRVAALCMHRGLFVYPKANGLRLSFVMNIADELLLRGAAILRSCLDDKNNYGSIEGETTRYESVQFLARQISIFLSCIISYSYFLVGVWSRPYVYTKHSGPARRCQVPYRPTCKVDPANRKKWAIFPRKISPQFTSY